MNVLINIIYTLFLFSARVFSKLSRVFSSIAKKFEPVDIQQKNVISSTSYDMVAAPDEPFYAEQYWKIISAYKADIPSNATIMDLGCGQGRFSILLSKKISGASIAACDLSKKAIEQAKEYASAISLNNIEFKVQSITDCIYSADPNSIDLLLLTEVTVFYPQWIKELEQMIHILKPGGVFVISLRSQYFTAMCMAKNRNWENIDTIIKKREGQIYGTSTVLTWQTSSEVKRILVEDHKLELLTMRGLGSCSGIPGDPHDQICQPSELTEAERAKLMMLELELGKSVLDSGRYILAVVRKPK